MTSNVHNESQLIDKKIWWCCQSVFLTLFNVILMFWFKKACFCGFSLDSHGNGTVSNHPEHFLQLAGWGVIITYCKWSTSKFHMEEAWGEYILRRKLKRNSNNHPAVNTTLVFFAWEVVYSRESAWSRKNGCRTFTICHASSKTREGDFNHTSYLNRTTYVYWQSNYSIHCQLRL